MAQFSPFISDFNDGGSAVGVRNAGDIALWDFALPFRLETAGIVVNVETADSTNLGDIGLYDLNGSLLAHTGPMHFPTTGAVVIPFTNAAELNAGTYLVAITSSASGGSNFQLDTCTNSAHFIWYYSTSSSSASGTLPTFITLSLSASLSVPNQLYGGTGIPLFRLV